jgi:hypothetical protein
VFRERTKPVSNKVMLGPTALVTKPFVKLVFLARWISKPVSVLEVSVQDRWTLSVVPTREAVARIVDGAVGGVVTVATLEYGEPPFALDAYTR